MKALWVATYEQVWNECDENTTEETIIAKTERRFQERLEAMIESRIARDDGRMQ